MMPHVAPEVREESTPPGRPFYTAVPEATAGRRTPTVEPPIWGLQRECRVWTASSQVVLEAPAVWSAAQAPPEQTAPTDYTVLVD